LLKISSMSPDISVIFTSYNHKEFLEQALEAIINQTYRNFELIIVDDCSTDGSQDILKRYVDDERVKLHLLEKNSGSYVNASNYGFTYASAQYVIFAQCDDFPEKNQFSELIKYAKTNIDAAVVFSSSNLINEKGNFILCDFDVRTKRFKKNHNSNSIIHNTEMNNYLLNSCVIPNLSAALIKKSIFEEFNFFSKKYFVLADWDLWLKISTKYNFYYLRQPLNNFRQHGTTIRNSIKLKRQVFEVIEMFYDHITYSNKNILYKLRVEYFISKIWILYFFDDKLLWISSFFDIYKHSWKKSKSLIFILVYSFLYNSMKKIINMWKWI
jgi:glycosyltransferase involved in cell wall biosynthesis